MRYHKIVTESYVDGPGKRAVLFLQGCPLACDGCQNKHLWLDRTPDTQTASSRDLALRLTYINPQAVTISGGEPFAQLVGLDGLIFWLRALQPRIHIIVYSGYTWEHIIGIATDGGLQDSKAVMRILNNIDILVDGPFVRSLDHNLINWRGSSNQRPINMPATLESGEIVVHDWDSAVIVTFTPEASYAPIGMAQALGKGEPTRRCGQTK